MKALMSKHIKIWWMLDCLQSALREGYSLKPKYVKQSNQKLGWTRARYSPPPQNKLLENKRKNSLFSSALFF